ncbi:MAG: EAL domain-containing protein [Synergistaceae bacterium]|nr:EAL domain-containing protein [Synergistota bacterium]NLM71550.1 EAL domain-containing protein [Synergistaceae bacterium]
MELAPLLTSLLFFGIFAIYLFFGIYAVHLNKDDSLNKTLFLLCLSFAVHSLGVSIASSAPSPESCLIWNKFAFSGHAALYALFLHFVMLLTSTVKKRRGGLFPHLLYLPTIVLIFAFSLSNDFSSSLYKLQSTELGYAHTLERGEWFYAFLTYQVLYVLLGLALLWRWGRGSQDGKIKGQARILMFSAILAFVPPWFMGHLLHSLRLYNVPSLKAFFPLLLLAGMYIAMVKFGLMRTSPDPDDELFLEELTNSKLVFSLGAAFIMGGITTGLAHFFPFAVQSDLSMRSMLQASYIFFLFGFLTLATQFIATLDIRKNAMLLVMLLSIPALTWQFIEYAAITIWVFPVVIMMVTLLFTSRLPLILVTAVAIATQIPVVINAPSDFVIMDTFDYAARISILLVAFFVGLLVNKTYVVRVKEIELQTRSQKLISEISTELVSINISSLDRKANLLLEKIATFFQADRASIFLFDAEREDALYSYEWNAEGVPPVPRHVNPIARDALSKWIDHFSENKFFFIDNTKIISDALSDERGELLQQGVKSAAAVPIEENGEILGFLGMQSTKESRKWSETHTELLNILSNLLADGFIRIRSEKEIELMAYYDQLTGLPNRTLFSDRLAQAIHLAKRNNRLVGVILMDLDSFKMINDTLGHSGGDALLKEVARSLQQRLRRSDTVARFGGDEFLILLNDVADYVSIAKAVEDIMEIFVHPFYVHGQNFFISGSAGAAVYPHDGTDEETLLKNADVAMYMAKSRGKNQYVMCTEDMKDEVMRANELSSELYGVQDRGELVMHYQPQFNLETDEIVGVEAFVRWNHPVMGIIPPGSFIPLAEMNGTIDGIGEWILRSAVGQRKRWTKKAPAGMRIAVNLSVVQLYNPDFVDNLAVILKEARLDPKYLELEIKECAAIRETELVLGKLKKLKKLGVYISIDDFGTECSSLSRLKILPIDRLKIDMPFVQGTERDAKDRTITTTIINLAKGLGVEVMAEGVETESQLNYLRQEECDDAQGFYYGKPMPADDLERLFLMG